jgi:osmotically-inducible protein OsmY
MRKQIPADKQVDDSELRHTVMSRLKNEPWAKTSLINVTVDTGAVDVWGIVDSEAEKQALRVAIEVTPGVRSVNNNVVVRPTSAVT